MRRLILFRHSKADRSQPGERDIDRALTERGRRDAAQTGAYIASHALTPDRVLLSPARRTQQTWEQAAAALQPAPAASIVERLYDASGHTVLAAVKEVPASARSVLVVGHNPGLHDLALLLAAAGDVDARERLAEKLPTSGLIVLDFAIDDWTRLHPHSGRLERFVTPRSLETGEY